MKTSSILETFLSDILDNASSQTDQAEIFHLDINDFSGSYRAGQLREMSESQNSGICLRIIKDGKIAQASTSNMDTTSELITRALELVKYGEPVDFSFPASSSCEKKTNQDPIDIKTGMKKIVDSGKIIVEKFKEYDSQIVVHAGGDLSRTTIQILNSHGIKMGYSRMNSSIAAIGILASEGNILQSYALEFGKDFCQSPDALADKVINMFKIGRNNIPFKGGTMPILFTPKALSDILAAFGSGISGSSVSKGISPLVGKLNEKILNERISILDDGLADEGTASQPFDDEGVPSQTKYMIKNGVLKNYLLDLKTAAKLGMEPNGSGFRYAALIKSRSYTALPGPSFTNLIIPAGKRISDDILASTKRILLIDSLTGVLLGNLINGDWSGNVEFGILYEHGEPVGRIKNAMTGGNFYKNFDQQFGEFSSDREWVSGFGGSSGSSLLPYTLINDMNIST